MMQRVLSWFTVATLVAAVVVLGGFLVSRAIGRTKCFDDNWELFLLATGVGVLGIMVVFGGLAMLVSVEGSFMRFTVPISLTIVAVGLGLCYLCYAVVTGFDCSPDPAQAVRWLGRVRS
jgi:hypothetical protein